MRLSEELDKRGIKYTTEIIDNSMVIKCCNDIVRIHLYKNVITICDKQGCISLPPIENTLQYILEVIKENGI